MNLVNNNLHIYFTLSINIFIRVQISYLNIMQNYCDLLNRFSYVSVTETMLGLIKHLVNNYQRIKTLRTVANSN